MRPRFAGYVEKSLREAKLRTAWTEVDEDYEKAVQDYAAALVSPGNAEFLRDFAATIEPFLGAGLLNSLSQTLIRLAAPGIPDIYQGAERLDLSLVDPDNRRPVDFAALARELGKDVARAPTPENIADGSFKQYLVASGLRLRAARPSVFAEGDYVPLTASGPKEEHVAAFLRRHQDGVVLALAPRMPMALLAQDRPAIPFQAWGDTMLEMPGDLAGTVLFDALDGRQFELASPMPVAALLGDRPVALLSDLEIETI